MGRELVFLLAQRATPGALDAWSEGTERVGERALEKLVLYWNGRRTTFCLDPETGRALRARWVGRLESGVNGEVVVDFDDFTERGGLVLPRSRRVTFDGEALEHLAFPLAVLEAN
jgi:hypothetical protein